MSTELFSGRAGKLLGHHLLEQLDVLSRRPSLGSRRGSQPSSRKHEVQSKWRHDSTGFRRLRTTRSCDLGSVVRPTDISFAELTRMNSAFRVRAPVPQLTLHRDLRDQLLPMEGI